MLAGKVGITSGIGARTAELFVAEGAAVGFTGRRWKEGEALAARLGEAARFVRGRQLGGGAGAAAVFTSPRSPASTQTWLFGSVGDARHEARSADHDQAAFGQHYQRP